MGADPYQNGNPWGNYYGAYSAFPPQPIGMGDPNALYRAGLPQGGVPLGGFQQTLGPAVALPGQFPPQHFAPGQPDSSQKKKKSPKPKSPKDTKKGIKKKPAAKKVPKKKPKAAKKKVVDKAELARKKQAQKEKLQEAKGVVGVTKAGSERWKQMTPEAKQPFEDQAATARDVYTKAKEQYEARGGAARFKLQKGPPRPPTAYFMFLSAFRQEYKLRNPEVKGIKDMSREA